MDGHPVEVEDMEAAVDTEEVDTVVDMVDKKLKLLKLLFQVSVLAKDGPEVVQVADTEADTEALKHTQAVKDILAVKDGPMVEEIKDGLTVVDTPVETKDGLVAEA